MITLQARHSFLIAKQAHLSTKAQKCQTIDKAPQKVQHVAERTQTVVTGFSIMRKIGAFCKKMLSRLKSLRKREITQQTAPKAAQKTRAETRVARLQRRQEQAKLAAQLRAAQEKNDLIEAPQELQKKAQVAPAKKASFHEQVGATVGKKEPQTRMEKRATNIAQGMLVLSQTILDPRETHEELKAKIMKYAKMLPYSATGNAGSFQQWLRINFPVHNLAR